MDPTLIKDVYNRNYEFTKPDTNPIVKYVSTGLVNHDGAKWAKHRKIINPAFNLEQLKVEVTHLLSN